MHVAKHLTAATWNVHVFIYRVGIKSFPDYKYLLQENYVEYKLFFLPLLKLVSKILCHVFIVMLQLHNLLVAKQKITDSFATITEDMLENTWTEIDYWLDVLRATNGAHVEMC